MKFINREWRRGEMMNLGRGGQGQGQRFFFFFRDFGYINGEGQNVGVEIEEYVFFLVIYLFVEKV